MKKIHFLVIVLLILSTSKISAQDEYMKDHVIVFFRDNVLNKSLLASEIRSFSRAEFVTEKALKDSLDNWNIGGTFQRVMRNARPDKLVTTSRTGEEVAIPMFYNLMYVPVPENEDVLTLCKKLNELPFVIYAEPDYIMRSNDVPPPNDLYFSLQSGWEQVNDRDIDLLRAWDFTRGSNNVRVGVLDGGIDYHNPDLGNGSYGSGYKVSGGYDYIDDDSNPDDPGTVSHGTAVAGIIGALSNNTTGVAGIGGGNVASGNSGVQLIALRVSQTDGDFPIGKVVEGIYDAATSANQGGFGCHILNYSAGGYNVYNSVRKAISYAIHNGVVFVTSKGNDESTEMHYPSDYADNLIISVGASNGLDQRADFSNYGNNIDFVAPGVSSLLYTTKRVEQGTYGSFNGTSGAAPVVSGIVALLKSVNINLHRDDIERIIEISAEDITMDPAVPGQFLSGYDMYTGHGRVNAGRALEFLYTPYVLQHHTTIGGTSQKITSGDGEPLMFLNDGGTTLPEGWYFGQKYQITKTVNIPLSGCDESYVWTRSVGATTGWSAANPNNNLGFSHIVSQTDSTVTLRTYVYYIKYNFLGQTINAWYPVSPENVTIAYTTLTNMPINSNITGPSIVCPPGVFSVQNLPPGCSITWNPGPYLTMTSQQGSNPCTFTANGSGASWVEATITDSLCGSTTLPKFYVQVNPVYNFISTEYDKDCSTVTLATNLPSYTSVTWNASSNFLIDGYYPPLSKQGNSIIVTSTDDNGGSVYGTTSLGCSITPYTTFCPCQSWSNASITWIWACPSPGEPLIAEVSPLHPDATEYKWYIGDQLIETTYDGYLQTYNWPCTSEMPHLYVTGVTSCGHTELIDGGEFFPACGGNKSSSNVILYPNPASSVVTITLEENQSPVILISSEIQINTLSEITQIKLIDKTGMTRKLMNFGKNTTKVSVQLSEFQSGVYYLDVTDGARHVIKPLTIKK